MLQHYLRFFVILKLRAVKAEKVVEVNSKEWRKRFKYRMDLSSRLTHLTKGVDKDDAFNNLINILEEKKIKGSSKKKGFICGEIPAVCLQDAPLSAIAENLQYEEVLRKEENQKVRYLGFGIRFQKNFIYQQGGRPVIYDDTDKAKMYLLKNEWWRIVKLDLSNSNSVVDWMHEREWRVPKDIIFNYSQCEVIVPSPKYYKRFVEYCLENGREDILLTIRGIVVMSSVYF